MDDMEPSRLLIFLIILIQFLNTIWNTVRTKLRLATVPKKIEEHTFNKDVTVLVIGRKASGRKSLIAAYQDLQAKNRFYFPSENIHFIRLNLATAWSGELKPDVIWFVINYHGHTKDKDFDILREIFPQIPVVVVLNKVDQLQEQPGHAFDLLATTKLPQFLRNSRALTAAQQRYETLQRGRKFLLSQVMLTSVRSDDDDDSRPAGLFGLYQATLNCMDDKQFERFDNATVTPEERNFLNIVRKIKRYKKNSWRIILICGSSNNGKSTLINALLKENRAPIGQDGKPTTKTLQVYPLELERSKVLLVDTAGLEKHDNADKFAQLTSIRPDLIWLIVNYAGSVETTELDISTKYFPNTALLLIVNKVDVLREVNIDERELNEFDKCVPHALKGFTKLMAFRSNLIKHRNVHRLVLLSLRKEEEEEKPIGLENLISMTKQYFSSRRTADLDEVELLSSANGNALASQLVDNSGLLRRNRSEVQT